MNTRFIWLSPVPPFKAGEVIGDEPTFPINAKVVGDFLYLRDENGNLIPGRQVDNGDEIVVLDVLYSKQLAMIQYPTSKGYVHGYVTNAVNIIKYNSEYNWQNGSTKEPVVDEENNQIGWLDSYEKATLLYKYPEYSTDRYCVLYNTDKGRNTKSGFVRFEGIQSIENLVKPGEIVGSTPTYPTNATVVKDFLYLRDERGNLIPGRQVDVGDRMTVLDVSYSRQLALVQYPTSQGFRQGYVTNAPELINYDDRFKWCNGSTSEPVLFEDGKEGLGSLSPYERATILYKHKSGMYHVVYGTDKGPYSKSGYVKYDGTSISKPISLPVVNESNVTKICYGTSEMGNPLEMYKIGDGKKILFAGFGIHGFEDEWFRDGIGLAHIANELIKALAAQDRSSGLNGWTVYVSQSMNPDGLKYGWSNNGPGRCTVGTSIDMNRCFPTKFIPQYNGRNYTSNKSLKPIEAQALFNKLKELKATNPKRMVVLDCHGWMNETMGDYSIGKYFGSEFGFGHRTIWGAGYFSTWAKELCGEALLVEYPKTNSLNDIYNKGLHTKTINAVKSIVIEKEESNLTENPLDKKGKVVNAEILNVRESIGTSNNIIGTLLKGAIVKIIAETNEWYKIKYISGSGYVFKKYIEIVQEEEKKEEIVLEYPKYIVGNEKKIIKESEVRELTYDEVSKIYNSNSKPVLDDSIGIGIGTGGLAIGVTQQIVDNKIETIKVPKFAIENFTGKKGDFLGKVVNSLGFVTTCISELDSENRRFWKAALCYALVNGSVKFQEVTWEVKAESGASVRYTTQIRCYSSKITNDNIYTRDIKPQKDIIIDKFPNEIYSMVGNPKILKESSTIISREDIMKTCENMGNKGLSRAANIILAIGGFIPGIPGLICGGIALTNSILLKFYEEYGIEEFWDNALNIALIHGYVIVKNTVYEINPGTGYKHASQITLSL